MQGTFSFEFQPLKPGETFGRLTLHNSDLGYYPYELSMKATPALPEKPVYFQAVLGSGQSIFAKFTNYTRQKTEYYCRVSSPCPALCLSLSRDPGSAVMGGGHRRCRCETQSQVLYLVGHRQLEIDGTRPGFFLTNFLAEQAEGWGALLPTSWSVVAAVRA